MDRNKFSETARCTTAGPLLPLSPPGHTALIFHMHFSFVFVLLVLIKICFFRTYGIDIILFSFLLMPFFPCEIASPHTLGRCPVLALSCLGGPTLGRCPVPTLSCLVKFCLEVFWLAICWPARQISQHAVSGCVPTHDPRTSQASDPRSYSPRTWRDSTGKVEGQTKTHAWDQNFTQVDGMTQESTRAWQSKQCHFLLR